MAYLLVTNACPPEASPAGFGIDARPDGSLLLVVPNQGAYDHPSWTPAHEENHRDVRLWDPCQCLGWKATILWDGTSLGSQWVCSKQNLLTILECNQACVQLFGTLWTLDGKAKQCIQFLI